MMLKINPFNLSLIVFLICICQFAFPNKFSYKEAIEIYAVTKHVNDVDYIESLINDKYNITKIENQIKYHKSLESIPVDEWNKFLKDAINYFLTIKRKYKIEFYNNDKGYNEKLNEFNDNFIINPSKDNVKVYWKVFFYEYRLPLRFIAIKERYDNGKLALKVYYNESRYIIKEIIYSSKGEEIYYYESNKKID
ncbi:MAG: hypothetical protein OEV44_10540 [Spirochaetota bacterium]|nr:hypothetical protein [Spirochaetota bacterium]